MAIPQPLPRTVKAFLEAKLPLLTMQMRRHQMACPEDLFFVIGMRLPEDAPHEMEDTKTFLNAGDHLMAHLKREGFELQVVLKQPGKHQYIIRWGRRLH